MITVQDFRTSFSNGDRKKNHQEHRMLGVAPLTDSLVDIPQMTAQHRCFPSYTEQSRSPATVSGGEEVWTEQIRPTTHRQKYSQV